MTKGEIAYGLTKVFLVTLAVFVALFGVSGFYAMRDLENLGIKCLLNNKPLIQRSCDDQVKK